MSDSTHVANIEAPAATAARERVLTPEILTLGAVVVLGAIMTILDRADGPQRLGRVMSIIGVPMLLAPISGPVIGGALVGGASWRWIFFVNLPVGAIAFALALRLLPAVPARPHERLDALGLVLL